MQSPGSPSANSGRLPSHNKKEVSTAAAMVENLARLAAGGSVRLLTAAEQVATEAQTTAERVMFSTIGLGIAPNFRRSEATMNGDDATDAACKALLDALERGSFWSFVSHTASSSSCTPQTSSSSSPQVQLSVRLGVPTKQYQPHELMKVDQHRILSQLSTSQRQHAGNGGGVTMELLHVDLTVGGLWAQHDSSGVGTLAVVASVSVVQQQQTPQRHQRRSSFSRPAQEASQVSEAPRGATTPQAQYSNSPVSAPKASSPQARISRRAAEQEAQQQQQFSFSAHATDASKSTAPSAWRDGSSSPQPRSTPASPQFSYTQAPTEQQKLRRQSSPTLPSTPQRYPSQHQAEAAAAAALATQRAQEFIHRSSSMDVLAHVSAELRDRQQRREEEEQSQQQQAMDEEDADPMDSTPATNALAMAAAVVSSSQYSEQDLDQDGLSAYGDKYGNNTNYKKLPPGKTPKNNKRLFVKHSYQDFSREVPSSAEVQQGETSKTVNAAFPLKLHETLSEIERDGHDDIVGWLAHGRSFKIHKQQEFVQLILPKYFVMTKKSSFLRQLNLYGFNRLSGVGPDQASYYHEKFLRGMKFLCRRMQRIKVNGNRIRAAGNPDEEPDLSSFPSCPTQQSQPPQEAAVSAAPSSLAAAHHDLATAAVLQFMAKQQQQQQQQQQSYIQRASGGPVPNAALSSLLALLPSGAPPASALLLGNNMTPSAAAAAAMLTCRRSFSENPPPPEPIAKEGRSPSLSSADSTTGGNNTNNCSSNSNTGGVTANNAMVSFPLKLQRILDKLESEGNCSVVSWLPHGRAFMVHNPDRFVHELMPLYFNQTKYSSFQRQLHMYNFQRITTGRDKGAYHHAQFQRGQPALCQTMQRTRVNGKGTRQPGNPQAEPDFYQLSPLPRISLGSVVEIPTQVVFPSSAIPAQPAAAQSHHNAGYAAPSVSSSSAAAESEEERY